MIEDEEDPERKSLLKKILDTSKQLRDCPRIRLAKEPREEKSRTPSKQRRNKISEI